MIVSPTRHTPAAVAAHYDELDHFYREIWGEHVHHGLWLEGRESSRQAARQLVELVARQAQVRPGSRVCDIGCGYGATARLLAEEFGAEVTAITVSEAQHRFAREQGGPVRHLLGDWLHNDLPAAHFDAAIAIESSEHMPDIAAFFAQAQRVLRPGGRLVICAWLSAPKPSALGRKLLLEPICREGRMPLMGSEEDYRALFQTAGFALEEVEDLSARVKKTWPICAGRFVIELLRQPRYLRFLLDSHRQNRIFALTIFRIWLAYELGTMRYAIFTGRRA